MMQKQQQSEQPGQNTLENKKGALHDQLEVSLSTNPPRETFKKDAGKIRYTLIPVDAMEEVVKVMETGANKYGPDAWRKTEDFDWTRIINALERHLADLKRSVDKDSESGLLHAAHIACNALFLTEYMLHGLGRDDRFKYKKEVK
jgi:hypothetical protein